MLMSGQQPDGIAVYSEYLHDACECKRSLGARKLFCVRQQDELRDVEGGVLHALNALGTLSALRRILRKVDHSWFALLSLPQVLLRIIGRRLESCASLGAVEVDDISIEIDFNFAEIVE
jgi:hypothetical protein